jgi:hypothetical protein
VTKSLHGSIIKNGGTFNSFDVLLNQSNVVYLYSHLVKIVRLLIAPKDYCVFGNDSLFELPCKVVTWIWFVITMLDDDD